MTLVKSIELLQQHVLAVCILIIWTHIAVIDCCFFFLVTMLRSKYYSDNVCIHSEFYLMKRSQGQEQIQQLPKVMHK